MRAASLFLVAFALLILVPGATAQVRPKECDAECDPRAADMNGPDPRTEGPIRTILYAPLDGSLTTHGPHSARRSVPGGPPYAPQTGLPVVDACVLFVWRSHFAGSDYGTYAYRLSSPFAMDRPLNITGPVTFYFYASTTLPYGTAVTARPLLQAHVRVATGEKTFAGETLAEGRLQAGEGPTAVAGSHWEHRVTLTPTRTEWGGPGSGGIHVAMRLCHVEQVPMRAALTQVTLSHGPETPTRLVLGVEPSVPGTLRFIPETDRLHVIAKFESVLGASDFMGGSGRLTIDGVEILSHRRDSSRIHGVAWPHTAGWSIARAALADGRAHEFRASMVNAQATFLHQIVDDYTFPVLEGAATSAPALFAVMLAVAAAAWLRPRR